MQTETREVEFQYHNGFRPEPTEDKWLYESHESKTQKNEWITFKFTTNTQAEIDRIDDKWDWFWVDEKGVDHKFDTTPKDEQFTWDAKPANHVVYIVLTPPQSPWYDTEKQRPWVTALEFTIVTANTKGCKTLQTAFTKILTFIHDSYGLYYDTFRGSPNFTKGGGS